MAFLTDITLNVVGDLDYRPTNSYTTIKFAASHTLSKVFGLGYNFGIASNGEVAKGFFVYSFVVGASVTKKLSAFAEVYGNLDDSQYPRTRLDGGLTFLVRPNLQLDLSASYGPEEVQSMWFISIGLSWRIPQ
ncbi:MAG: transporter [Bacteroidales bacterium]